MPTQTQGGQMTMYKFKTWISDSERAEVMKIIKYTKGGLVYLESLYAHPELKEYFEPVQVEDKPKETIT